MRILGIDPGLASTGWVVIENDNLDGWTFVNGGIIQTATTQIQAERLHTIATRIDKLLNEYMPQRVAMENLSRFGTSAGKLATAEALGVIRLRVWEWGRHVSEYQPNSIKKVVAGHGKSTKEQVRDAVIQQLAWLPPNFVEHETHISDAAAIALMEVAHLST